MTWLVRYKNRAGEDLTFTVNATDQCEAYDVADRMFKGTDDNVMFLYSDDDKDFDWLESRNDIEIFELGGR